jgi:hypothetical protein
MFKYLRIQIVHPCQAKCAWCSTYLKNPRFSKLHRSGGAGEFHEFYREVAAEYKPEEIFVSGGEPLLFPGIGKFLRDLSEHTKRIHVFTSFQFNRAVMDRFAQEDLPGDMIVLNHTPIYFEPERWHELTRGFPFDVYIDNIRRAVKLPLRKRFKFIINHSGFVEEIARFQELVTPDERCEISLKMMNDQGDGLGVDTMQRTAGRVRERLGDLDRVLAESGWNKRPRPETSADLMKPVIESGDVEKCVYRKDPLELRLSFYRGGEGDGKSILKYRYCPYFPPDFGHKFHIGRDDIKKLGRNYKKGPFREHCDRCRMRHYHACPGGEKKAPS